jgi:2-polyprenyl-6-methoxyphenol hydroxylase-like FAD-dependent oxidoreductase
MNPNSESPTCFVAGKKIVVAGGGIAGLAFVVALRKQWQSQPPSFTPPAITLYERDPKDFGVEREGYSISIRSDSNCAGMQTLQRLGLLDRMLSLSITGIQENPGTFCLWDKEWKEILRIFVSPPANLPAPGMRIKRNVLRETLIEAVNATDKIHWGTTCTGAVKLSNGKVGVQLSNGRMDECDLLIAADGANSKIRSSFRSDEKLSFTGAVSITGASKFKDGIPPPVNRDWGSYLSGTGPGLFVSPVDEHNAIWSLSYLTPEPREVKMSDDLRREALERGKGFSEPFQTLVKATDAATLGILNNKDRQPFPHLTGPLEDVHIVFIGDANHAVSPFAGAGANLALVDGWDLAAELCKFKSLSDALTAYDKMAIPRSKAVVRNSHLAIGLAHCTGWRFILYTWLARVVAWLFMR